MSSEIYERIEWFHYKTAAGYYPNASRIAEQFGISTSRAHRDIAFLRQSLAAPLVFDFSKNGYYYSESYVLPVAFSYAIGSPYEGRLSSLSQHDSGNPKISVVQFRIPYTAKLKITDRLALLELRPYITEKKPDGVYLCEYPHPDIFFNLLMTLPGCVSVIEPDSLRERLAAAARCILEANS